MADPPIPYLPIEPGILQNHIVRTLQRSNPQIGAWVFLHVLLGMGNQDGSRWMHGLLEFDTRDISDDLTKFLCLEKQVSPGAVSDVLKAWKRAKNTDRFMVEIRANSGGGHAVKIYWAGFRKRAEPAAINRIRVRKAINSNQAREYLIKLFDSEIANFSSKFNKNLQSKLRVGYCASKVKKSKVNNPPISPTASKRDIEKKGDKSPHPKKARRGGSELPQTGVDKRTGEPTSFGDFMRQQNPDQTETERTD